MEVDIVKLIEEYADRMVNNLDFSQVKELAKAGLMRETDNMTQDDIIEMIADIYPDLLEQNNDE